MFNNRKFLSVSLDASFSKVYAESEVNFTIVQTTYIHGMIFPYNFITGKITNTSIAHILSYIKKLKSGGKAVFIIR